MWCCPCQEVETIFWPSWIWVDLLLWQVECHSSPSLKSPCLCLLPLPSWTLEITKLEEARSSFMEIEPARGAPDRCSVGGTRKACSLDFLFTMADSACSSPTSSSFCEPSSEGSKPNSLPGIVKFCLSLQAVLVPGYPEAQELCFPICTWGHESRPITLPTRTTQSYSLFGSLAIFLVKNNYTC